VTGGYYTESKVKRRFNKLNQKLKYSRTLKAQKLVGEKNKNKNCNICVLKCIRICIFSEFFFCSLNNKIEKILGNCVSFIDFSKKNLYRQTLDIENLNEKTLGRNNT